MWPSHAHGLCAIKVQPFELRASNAIRANNHNQAPPAAQPDTKITIGNFCFLTHAMQSSNRLVDTSRQTREATIIKHQNQRRPTWLANVWHKTTSGSSPFFCVACFVVVCCREKILIGIERTTYEGQAQKTPAAICYLLIFESTIWRAVRRPRRGISARSLTAPAWLTSPAEVGL